MQNAKERKLIIFEGTDGVGKTTTAKLLQEIIERDHGLKTSYLKGMGSANFFGRLAKRFPSTALFMLEAAWSALKANFLRAEMVLMDRSYISVISHWPEINSGLNRAVIALTKPLLARLCRPNLVAYLFSDLDVQLKRIAGAADNRFHSAILANPWVIAERNSRMQKLFNEFEYPVVKIDTTDVPPGIIAQTIINFLKL